MERIASRRAQIDDPNAWRLSDDPVEVLAYLRRYSSGVPRWVAEADVLDGLTLRLRLWWIGEEAELWLLERGRRLGIPPRSVGQRLGIGSRQGVHDRLRLVREKISRLTGAPHPGLDPTPDDREREAETAWLHDHRADILEIAAEAAAHQHLADDEAAEWLAEVARDVRERVVTRGSVQTLRFALVDLGASAQVVALDAGHPLQALLDRWARLYASYPYPASRPAR